MNLYDYLEEYQENTFEEKPLNEIDIAIFSFLSYIDFEPYFKDQKEMTIEEAGKKHVEIYNQKQKNIVAVKEANKILRCLKNYKRYQNCILKNYEYIGDESIQFGVLCIEYEKDKLFVSFEGTDALFSGWKENFLLSSEYPTLSHKSAIRYLNRHFRFAKKELILGGHSKGGNLALVSAMECSPFVKRKIKRVYSIDGPGLLDKQYQSRKYQRIKKIFTHIIPDYSIIGILLNHSNDKVVHSKTKGLLAHNIANWEVEGNHFVKSTLSPLSKEIDKRLSEWIKDTSNEDKIDITNSLYQVLQKAKVRSINELKENKTKIFDILKNSTDISTHTKNKIKELIFILIKSIETTKKEEMKSIVTNFFKMKEQNETK